MDFVKIFVLVTSFLQASFSFPANLPPRSTYKNVPTRIFIGNKNMSKHQLQFVQTIKPMLIAGEKRIVIASRENLYFLEPSQFSATNSLANISHNEILTWKSNSETRDLCRLKGQSRESCYNYLNVVEMTNQRNLLLCGTNAYAPTCTNYQVSVAGGKLLLTKENTEISGKQRSPFGPNQRSVSLFTGGSLYAATFQSFFGGIPIISRSLGEDPPLRTATTSTLMNEPKFVKMSEDEKRILVYFNEIQELEGGEKRTVAQVAQVCKNDRGGDRVLLRMFTTFLKTRLNCSYHGFYLDEVRDVTEPVTMNGRSVVFATFSTPEHSLPGSAVCSFPLDSIELSMSGSFVASGSSTVSPPVTARHPGGCPEQRPTEDELVFIKNHPQMEKHVIGSLLTTNSGKRWTALAVDAAAGPRNTAVIIIGTEEGHLIRSLLPHKNQKRGTVISEQDVFDETKCSGNNPTGEDRKILKINLEGDSILVAFKHCVVTIPVVYCHVHECREACLSSADPYCGWNGSACIRFVDATQRLEQDITSAISTTPKSCPYNGTNVEIVLKVEEGMKSTEKTPSPPKSQPSEQESQGNNVQIIMEQSSKEMYPFKTLILVGLVTCAVTLCIIVFVFIVWFLCCKRGKREEEEIIKRQMEEAQRLALDPDEKRGSLSEKARKTYRSWKDWVQKATTPEQTPQLAHEARPLNKRRLNDYTEAPTLRQKPVKQSRSKRSSSRLNSVSSTTSRQSRADIVGYAPVSQSLQCPVDDVYYPVTVAETSCMEVNVTNTSTLHRTSKPTGDSPSSSASPAHSSSSSPFYPESGAGAAECGVLPTASAKLRRRNERAAHQTNEIMRESDTAIKAFESTLLNMQEQGIKVQQPALQNLVTRQRLDSNDSGKGESPRNSLRTDQEQSVSVMTSRPQRPASLNVQRHVSVGRQRLLSEGSHPQDDSSPVVVMPWTGRQRSLSGQHPSRSQPTTPDGSQQRHAMFSQQHSYPDIMVYSTLPKNDCPGGTPGHRKHQQHFVQQPNGYPPCAYSQQEVASYQQNNNQMKQQRPHSISELKRRDSGLRVCTSPVKPPTNFYPSLQVRGAHAQKMPYPPPQQQHVCSSPPKNQFTSLPRQTSVSPYVGPNNNSYASASGFERPNTLHKREKLPSVMRQSSMPGSARPAVFVPPPTIPRNAVA